MILRAIQRTLEENTAFRDHPDCRESLIPTIEFYQAVGFQPPWIGYYFQQDEQLVGVGAFKGAPIEGRVEIAYGTFGRFRNQGVGTTICLELVALALQTDSRVVITARTLPEKNYSTRILAKCNFDFAGMVFDQEDGEVWEWIYNKER